MKKRILVTGGTGFIGQSLCQKLIAEGHILTVLSRQPAPDVQSVCGRVEAVNDLEKLRDHEGFHAVINLAGEGIADKRWSESRKQELRDSRIALTNQLVDVIRSWQTLPPVLVSGSAVGFYGDQGSRRVTEDTPPNDEFTHRLCSDWEQAALRLEPDGVRVCLSRTGVVAGPGGGFLQRMLPPFKLGLGGRLGSGEQYMPWVHRDDVVAALIWMMDNEGARGAYNVVSPNPVTNRQFTKCLAGVLGRPAIFPVPAPVLKVALGEMSRLLLTGQMAIPERLEAEGFEFRFPDLSPALADAVGY
ncbi:TIGR01777 family oxidoreductase [Marinobacter orientalis]|uniref:TIGR01777 family protein n=1 Tax=Marinobacter orientalis TaxID=1928859 RepID=A0A7Y0WTD9_9GAMM|nr:TIGR01777 family oxidoreductase [Marinobacter orientalis]NMT64868.1 TIGR01777 family protein [Marinobacter orientalis]TGX48857.1 TIGR01777 family protein [Marinobacter orientalis]